MKEVVLVVLGALIAFVLTCIANWIGRRRSAFNEVAAPIRTGLIKDQLHPSLSIYISDADAARLSELMLRWKRDDFSKALAAYQEAKANTDQGPIGQVFLKDPESVRIAATALLPFTKFQ